MKKKREKKKLKVALLVSTLPIFLGGAYFLSRSIFQEGAPLSYLSANIDEIITGVLLNDGVASSAIKKNHVKKNNGKISWDQVELVVDLDESFSLDRLRENLMEHLGLPALLVKERSSVSGDTTEVNVSVYLYQLPLYQILLRQKKNPPPPVEPAEPLDEQAPEPMKDSPKIALIVDDVGYDMDLALELINLRHPMTISILPQLSYSHAIAEAAHKMGYEIMLHLPMEPGEPLKRNPGFINQHMNEKEMTWIMDRDLESVPYASGVNNHQGSKMTKDEEAMILVMKYLAEKNLYFVDSLTISDSIAFEVAREIGLPAAENDVFLDNEKDFEYVRERLELLMKQAREKGKAIGICHLHPVTIQALRDMLPEIQRSGIDLVYVSEVVNGK